MNYETLLMTWTISPKKDQKWYKSTSFSTEVRKAQYLKAIIFYVTQSKFNNIIFCENSDYKFEKTEMEVIEYLKNLYHKNIELLHFKWNTEKVNKQWYWYWEWECLDYAFDNSKILKDTKTFYKITWRYIIWNINEIIDSHKNCQNIFIRDIPSYFTMNTAFFKMETELYRKYFYNAKKLVNHSQNINFESAFYKIIFNENLFNLPKRLRILPYRTNCNDDNFIWNIHQYNVMKRPKFWYDYIWIKTWLYSISSSDKFLYNLITPLTRRK